MTEMEQGRIKEEETGNGLRADRGHEKESR